MDHLEALLSSCTWPSEALWRSFELGILRDVPFQRPILELGCGDGDVTSLLLDHVEDAIDLNPRAVHRARRTGVYGRVECMDARQLATADAGRYGTVFANCVLEHIRDLPSVLESCAQLLQPGGTLVATVPTVVMNDHLALRLPRYAELRRPQLVHHNLWSVDQWREHLARAGFDSVDVRPYFGPELCRFWDLIDAPACIGIGSLHVGAISRRLLTSVLPRAGRVRLQSGLAAWLRAQAAKRGRRMEPACAVLLLATTPS